MSSYFSKTDLSHFLHHSEENIKKQYRCEYENVGFCKCDCPSKHASKGIICRNSLVGSKCSDKCRFQHPNQRCVQKTLQTIYISMDLDSPEDQKKFLKKHVVKCPIRMGKENCTDSLCNDSKCNRQHVGESNIAGKQAFELQQTLNGNLAKLVDCPPSSFEYELLVNTWNEKKARRQIVKVEKVINPALGAIVERRKAELQHKWLEIDFLFHGTAESSIKLIIDNGFDASKNTRAAYGPGIYFAFDPNVAIGYSNEKNSKKLIVCKSFLALDASDHKYVDQNTWFVVQNTSGLQPMYVLTFA